MGFEGGGGIGYIEPTGRYGLWSTCKSAPAEPDPKTDGPRVVAVGKDSQFLAKYRRVESVVGHRVGVLVTRENLSLQGETADEIMVTDWM